MLLLLLSVRLFPQTAEQELFSLLKTEDSDKLVQSIHSLIYQNKGTPFALYLEAVTESDAGKAVEKYKQLLSKFPKSIQAEIALIKIAHFYFSRGLYVSGRKYYLQLVEKYPQSSYSDEALYFAAACLYASGKYESCYAELKNFLRQNPGSSFTYLAKEDVKDLNKKDQFLSSIVDLPQKKGKYALQIGAFAQVNNALNLKKYCKKLGIPVEIREKNANDVNMYLVWIGAFITRASAEIFGTNFKNEHGKPFRIVER